MAKLGKGVAAIKAKAEGNSGGKSRRKASAFTPLFRTLKPGEDVFLQFRTDLEDVEEVALHTFVRVPSKREGAEFDFEVFASRTRNDRFGDTYSILEEEMDHWPEIKFAGIAVLLGPVYDGKGTKIKNIKSFNVLGNEYEREDGTTTFFPSWQLVFQSSNSFWSNLLSIHEQYGITEYPLHVTRYGTGRETKYNFLPITTAEPIDFSEIDDNIPTIDEEIERLGSEERYNEYFGPGKPRLKQKQEYPPATKPQKLEQEEEEAPEPKRKPRSKVDFDSLASAAENEDEKEPVPY